MNLVQLPSVAEVQSSALGRALDRYAAAEGVVGIFVPETRWPFLHLPPHITWRGYEDPQMALACLLVHKASNFVPTRLHIGELTIYVQSRGCQTVGLAVRTNSAAVKSVARMMRRMLELAAAT